MADLGEGSKGRGRVWKIYEQREALRCNLVQQNVRISSKIYLKKFDSKFCSDLTYPIQW